MINNVKETMFQDLESGINSNNQSSGQLVDLDQSPNVSKLDPTMELHQLDAIRQKRDIFDKNHFRALNLGHKADVSEDDCLVSNQSQHRSDPMASLSSLSHKFTLPRNQNQSHSRRSYVGSSSKILNYSRIGKDELKSSSRIFSPIDKSSVRQTSKLSKYQTYVQQIQEQQEKQEEAQVQETHRDKQLRQSFARSHSKNGLNVTWTTNGFGIIRLVSRFIQQLKTKTEKIKFRLLTERIFMVINDISANFDYILIQRWIKQKPNLKLILQYIIFEKAKPILALFQYVTETLSKYLIVIQPDSLFKIAWDIILLFFIIINIFYIPIYISFEIKPNGIFEYLFDLLPSWIFVVEIILNFNTAYYDKGLMHEDRKSIMKHYVKGNFLWDLIVVVPYLLSYLDIPFVRYTLLLRVTRISSIMESIEEVLNLEENLQLILELIKLVFFLVLTGHFCGCTMHFVGITEYDTYGMERNWMTEYEKDIMSFEWFDRYIISLYWSVITTVTVGYGDIVPVTTFERIFVIIITLLICGVFGYCISNIGNIFKQMSDKKMIYKSKIRNIRQYMRKRGVSYNLQLKVNKYFEYFFQVEHDEEGTSKDCLKLLSKHLKQEVMIDLYSKILKNSRFLRENFDDDIINSCSQYVQELQILPEQMVFLRNEKPRRLWIILSGGIEYYADHQNEDENYLSTETQLKKFGPGSVIGEIEFITQQAYEYQARAIKFTQLIYIEYDDFIKVLKENQQSFERFCLIRDNLLFNPTYKGFGQVCEVCQWTHHFLQCPFVFLQPNKNKIANRFTQSTQNKRLSFPYRNSTKNKCFSNLGEIQEGALGYIVLNNILSQRQISDEYLVDLGFQLNTSDEEVPDQKPSYIRNQQQTNPLPLDQQIPPQMMPSIQTVDQKSQSNTAFFTQQKDKYNLLNSSMDQKDSLFDWDQGSQLKKSTQKIKFGSIERGRTIQSIRSKHQQAFGDMDESVVQEDNRIQSMLGSQQFIYNKIKMVRSKHQQNSNLNVNQNRKVSFQDAFDNQFMSNNTNGLRENSPPILSNMIHNTSGHQDSQDNRSVKKNLYTKEMSGVSAKSGTQERQERQDIVKRMEARENSIISKKQSNVKNEITRRVKRRKTTNINIGIQSSVFSQMDQQTLQHLPDSRSNKRNESSGIITAGMFSQGFLNDADNIHQNQSIAVAIASSQQMLQNKVQEIIHEHQNIDIDVKYSSPIYFPDLNPENIINKLNMFYEQKLQQQIDDEMKEMKRTRTNMTLFDRIKNKTQIRTNQDKSYYDQ